MPSWSHQHMPWVLALHALRMPPPRPCHLWTPRHPGIPFTSALPKDDQGLPGTVPPKYLHDSGLQRIWEKLEETVKLSLCVVGRHSQRHPWRRDPGNRLPCPSCHLHFPAPCCGPLCGPACPSMAPCPAMPSDLLSLCPHDPPHTPGPMGPRSCPALWLMERQLLCGPFHSPVISPQPSLLCFLTAGLLYAGPGAAPHVFSAKAPVRRKVWPIMVLTLIKRIL